MQTDPASSSGAATQFNLFGAMVDNWRWQDGAVYLRTGKRLADAVSEISIRFRDVPHSAFPAVTGINSRPVRLVSRSSRRRASF